MRLVFGVPLNEFLIGRDSPHIIPVDLMELEIS